MKLLFGDSMVSGRASEERVRVRAHLRVLTH